VKHPLGYAVFYVDVTGLSAFAGMVNIMLLSLAGFIWLLASGAATILAGTITRPIRLLSKFSKQIGEGNFAPNNMVFNNEEFDSLNQHLNQMANQLAHYDNEQKTFFQNVSHELRTPLMSIKCYAEGIQYGVMEPAAASQTILSETDRLADMVDDILYISRIDNITPTQLAENTDMGKLAAECVSRHQAVSESRQIRLILETDDGDKTVRCAPKHITRALSNLISNALRYAESTVKVSCKLDGGGVCFTVSDDGPGIADSDKPHLFERFYKGKEGLNGIGLSMVKSITEQHQGSVSAANGAKGAVFTMKLPKREA
jgi:signal transduction histidine kinase